MTTRPTRGGGWRGSIRRELTSIIMLTSTVALLLACAGFLLNDIATLRQSMKRNLAVLAQVIAENSAAALVFDDPEAAQEVLGTLSAETHITRGAIFRADGEVFSTFLRDLDALPSELPAAESQGSRFEAGRLLRFHEIRLDGDLIGSLFIESDLKAIDARLLRYALIGLAFLLGSSLVAFLVATVLQRSISGPILELAAIARKVSDDKEYSIRAPRTRRDNELAALIDGFNEMLNQIEARDAELERHRDNLEDEVAARTAELMAVNMQLEKATQHKSEFLANMSHELRTPLNAVIGFSEVLQERMFGELNDKQAEYVDDILTSGRHLLSLINDILDLSKIEAGRMELAPADFHLPSAIENAVMLVRERVTRHGQTLNIEIDSGLDSIHADERKVKQILLNLLSNAAKFTPDGGTIDVRARAAERHVEISVEDTGIGIPAEELDTIFEEFRQVRGDEQQKHEGTGLGLTLTKKFVELHGGRIWVESRVGSGTVFTFTLPMRPPRRGEESLDQRGADTRAARAAVDEPDAARPTVLVIEDDPRAAELLAIHLRNSGFAIAVAATPQQGLELARSLQPIAITLDILMPDIDGWDLLALLKSDPKTSHIPVVIVSMLEDRRRGFALGAADYLVKPVSPSDLVAVLRRASQPVPNRTPTILAVDDDPRALELLTVSLKSHEIEVLTAGSGREALALAAKHRPDLMIVDLLMPDMDGFQVVEELRKNEATSAIPVVILTAKSITSEDKERLRGKVTLLAQKGDLDRDGLLSLTQSLIRATEA